MSSTGAMPIPGHFRFVSFEFPQTIRERRTTQSELGFKRPSRETLPRITATPRCSLSSGKGGRKKRNSASSRFREMSTVSGFTHILCKVIARIQFNFYCQEQSGFFYHTTPVFMFKARFYFVIRSHDSEILAVKIYKNKPRGSNFVSSLHYNCPSIRR